MINLKHETKSGNSPQGKERVYFTCHPDDFDTCFGSICKEIFQHQNCVIYHKEDLTEKWTAEDIEIELGRMKLFIIPITTPFLTQENEARDIELPFAIEHAIPVLPLIQEAGLEPIFTEKCYGLHALNKETNAKDSTAISYEEKLEKFLASVLLGDDISKKVRDEFVANIFMSYRKKDREHEQELMHLIHKNDFCRDVSIWYDEFLVPGEKFEPEIQDAMDKSNFVSVVVTPNLLEDPNYVKDEEYPNAEALEKPILPIEMVPTDIEKIRGVDNFKNMPDPIDAEDEASLSEALSTTIHSLNIERHSDNPDHLYLIGLAYLNGIDMEVDDERAVGLITAAAEADLPEAMIRLSEMYRTGAGVKRDYDKFAFWLDRHAKYWKNKFEESSEEEDLLKYCEALRDLGDAWFDTGKLDNGKSVYLKLLSIGKDSITKFGGSTFQELMVFCYTNLGKISKTKGNLTEAEEYWHKSRTLKEDIVQEMETHARMTSGYIDPDEISEDKKRITEANWDLVTNYINLGEIYMEEEKFPEGEKWCKKALGLMNKLSEETGILERPWNMAGVLNNLGVISLKEGRFDDADRWYRKALELRELLDRETGTLESCMDLVDSYNNFGTLYRAKEEFGAAKDFYLKAKERIEELDSGTREMLGARIKLSDIFCNLAGLCVEEENYEDAKKWHLEEVKLKETLSCETESLEIKMDLADSYINLGAISMMEEEKADFSIAKAWFDKALRLSEELYSESKTPKVRQNLAGIYQNLGKISLEEKNYDDAKDYYLKSMELTGETDEERLKQVGVYISYAKVCMEKEVYTKAREWLVRALGWMEKRFQDTLIMETGINLSVIYGDLGACSRGEGDLDDAKEWYVKGKDLLEKFSCEKNDLYVVVLRNQAILYDIMGEICLEEGSIDQAKDWYQQSLAVKEELDQEISSVDTLVDLAFAFYVLGTLDENHYDFLMLENAKNLLEQAVGLYPQEIQQDMVEQKIQLIQCLLEENNK